MNSPRNVSHDRGQEYFPLCTITGTNTPPSTGRRNLLHRPLDHDISTEALIDNSSTLNQEDTVPTSKQSDIKHSYRSPAKRDTFSLRDWQWEFLAAGFSLVCVAVVIVVLAAYQEKPLSSWHFVYNITPNTLVALLSTLSRTALIVPVASCISQLKWIHLVSSPRPLRELQVFDDASRGPWGSLELIWRMHFKTKLATWGSVITILSITMGPLSQQLLSYPSRLHFETSGATFYRIQIYDSGASRGVTGAGYLDRMMDPKMQGAILNGLYNLSAPVQIECETGNCRWDEFTTLAVISNCTNATSETSTICDPGGRQVSCNYTTPSGFFIESSTSQSSGGGSETQFNTTARTQMSSHQGSKLNSSIVSFAAANMIVPFSQRSPDITECDMRWVARRIRNTTVVNGTFHPGIMEDIELYGIDNPFNERFWVTFNVTDEYTAFPGNRTFSVGPTDSAEIMEFLSDIFSSTLKDSFGLALYNSTNLTETVAMISASMTYAMGQGPTGTKVPGQAISFEQYIFVSWAWISLPVVEVAMGIAFLVCTLVHTRRKRVVAWKSSAIVPLLTGMDGWDHKDLSTASWRDVEKRAKGMRGVLVPDEDDVQRFRRVET